MSSIDYARFALVLMRCAEIARDEGAGSQVRVVYQGLLEGALVSYLRAHDEAVAAQRVFEADHADLNGLIDGLDAAYGAARAVVKEHFSDAGLPSSLLDLGTLFDKLNVAESLLNILDDSFVDEPWAAKEMNGPFGRRMPGLLKDAGAAVLSDAPLFSKLEERALRYGPAYERHLQFKRVVRQVYGPASGHYQSIHWRASWGKEGAGPVSWGPFSFRAPFRTW